MEEQEVSIENFQEQQKCKPVSLFEEVHPLLDVAIAVHSIAQLRYVARKSIQTIAKKEKWTPEETSEIVKHLKDSQDLPKSLDKKDSRKLIKASNALQLPKTPAQLLEAFNSYRKNRSLKLFFSRVGGARLHEKVINSAGMTLVGFNEDMVDTGPTGTELVYGIFVDDVLQRIVVVFRGSISGNDWKQDAKVNMTELSDNVRVHSGFHSYLLENKTGNMNKFDEITTKVKELLKEYPDYKVHVTGHSLGGAISTLFAYMLAKSPELDTSPITIVSFGSPAVGSADFVEAFRELEDAKKLRHLRVTNVNDIVPSVPISTIPSINNGRVFRYEHVGINLQQLSRRWCYCGCRRERPYQICYPKKKREASLHKVVEDVASMDIESLDKRITPHLLEAYHARFYSIRRDLEELELDALYRDPQYACDQEEEQSK